MKKIEKTKQNIGVSSLDETTRKKLFNEFVEAGGEVITEKEERRLNDFDRDLQRRFKIKLEMEKNQNKYPYSNIKAQKKPTVKYQPEVKQKYKTIESLNINEISQFRLMMQRFIIRFRLFFMNVADFTGYYFTLNFLKKFDEEYNPCLLSMQTTYFNIFKQNMRNGKRIIDSLDKIHPVYFEIIELLSNIFDRTTSNEILEHYYNFPDVPQEIKELREPLTRIFRKLYPLSLYKDLILTGTERALTLQTRLEKKKFTFFHANKRKVKNNLYIIFNKLYPRLLWLMCGYEKRIFLSDSDIEETISILPEDMPGRRKSNAPKTLDISSINNLSLKDIEKQEKEKAEKEKFPDTIKSGLDIMSKINLGKSSEIFIKNRLFKSINLKDKIFITSLLFNEFDKEFSFILTTNKIKYNTIYKSTDNIDYKNKFASIYNEIGKYKNRFLEYANAVAAYEKLKQEKPISSTQFIEYSNRLTALDKEKNQIGSDARFQIKTFMEKLCKELKTLIDDVNRTRDIVINPDDVLSFETAIEGEKILNHKNIYEAINYTYNYAMAFIFRLSLDGDLSGSMEFSDGEGTIFDSSIYKEIQQSKENIPKENIPIAENIQKETTKKQTILKELDDLM
jgi:hypothetical protein